MKRVSAMGGCIVHSGVGVRVVSDFVLNGLGMIITDIVMLLHVLLEQCTQITSDHSGSAGSLRRGGDGPAVGREGGLNAGITQIIVLHHDLKIGPDLPRLCSLLLLSLFLNLVLLGDPFIDVVNGRCRERR